MGLTKINYLILKYINIITFTNLLGGQSIIIGQAFSTINIIKTVVYIFFIHVNQAAELFFHIPFEKFIADPAGFLFSGHQTGVLSDQ